MTTQRIEPNGKSTLARTVAKAYRAQGFNVQHSNGVVTVSRWHERPSAEARARLDSLSMWLDEGWWI